MQKYIVDGTHIKHAGKGEKKARIYGPGDEIALTEEEAAALGKSVMPAGDRKSGDQNSKEKKK